MQQVEETNWRGGRRRKWKASSIMHSEQNSLLSNSQALPAGRDSQASKMSLQRALKKVKEVTVFREFPLCMYKK